MLQIISALLKDLKNESPFLLSEYFGPFMVFGQFDVVFGYHIRNIDHGARLFYAILDTINRYLSGARLGPIRDFHRILAFEWAHDHIPSNDQPCLSYFSVKMNYSSRNHPNNLHVSELIERMGKHVSRMGKHGVLYKVLGTLSWNEVMILVYGNSYDKLVSLARMLRKSGLVSNLTPLLLRDPNFSVAMPESWWFMSQLAPLSCIQPTKFQRLLDSQHLSHAHSIESLNDYIVAVKFRDGAMIDSFLESVQQIKGLEYTNSGFYRMTRAIDLNGEMSKARPSSMKEGSRRRLDSKEVIEKLSEISGMPIARRKLMALLTQVRVLRGIPKLLYLFPDKLISSVEYLVKETSMSDDTINYYISELSMAITERLSGVQMDVLVGKDLGFLEKHGGFQRLVLACESMIQRIYSIYLDREVKRSFPEGDQPQLFVFFDYGARLSSDIPAEILGHGIDANLPIIIRLRMLRYKPWLWITGVREVSKLVYYISGNRLPLEVLQDDPNVTAFSDEFVRHFLTYENFRKLLAEELDFFSRQSDFYPRPR